MNTAERPVLNGQIAVVVGGVAPGGRAVARRLAREGAIVVVADLNDTESSEVADVLAADGLPVEGMGIDVTSPESVEAAFALVTDTYGLPTLLCYGVGFHLDSSILDTAPERWRHGLESNLAGAWLCTREFLRRHQPTHQRPASIVYLLSEMGERRNDALTAVTLAGAEALARVVERDNAHLGLRAGVIVSGPLPGSGAERVFRQAAERKGVAWKDVLQAWKEESGPPLSQVPEDLAEAVVQFVCRQRDLAQGSVFRLAASGDSPDPLRG